MARLICGRCGHRTAENSTYCSTCHWTLYVDAPDTFAHNSSMRLELPRSAGILARRKQEHYRAKIERELREFLDPRVEKFEEQLEDSPDSFELQRSLGIATLLEGHWQRASAHLERAYHLNPNDYETAVNYGIVLAQRGQSLPAIEVLRKARKQWPDKPLVLFNLALAALQARRGEEVIELFQALERLWYENPNIAEEYHDDAQTLRGMALLLLKNPTEAKAALEAAASHTVTLQKVEEDPAMLIPTKPEDVELAAEDAIEIMSGGDIEEDEFAEPDVLQLGGKAASADFLNNLAMAEAALGEIDAAVSRLYAAIRMDPGHTRVLNNLGVLAYEQGRFDIAFKYLETARQIEEFMEKPDPATSNHLGVVLSALGRLDESMTRFQRAGSYDSAEFEVYYNLGRAYIEHGRPEDGVEYLRQSFALNPHSADVHTVLGAAYLLRGKPELLPEALKHLKRALQLNPRHRVAFTDLGVALVDSQNVEGAAKVIRQAIKVHPKSAETLFLLGILVMEQGDESHWIQASTQFGSAYESRNDLIAAVYNAALCQYLLGFRDTAAQQLQHVTDKDPSFAPAYYMIGVGHAVGKRFKDALTAWHTALKYEPNNPDLHANLAYVYYLQEDYKTAVKHYMAAHRIEPGNGDFLSALGLCFARAEMFDQAITAFNQSLKLNVRSPITHSNLGLAFYLHKQVENAIHHWRVVSQLDSTYAKKKEEEEQRTFDDSLVSMRPLNWRSRIIRLAPTLPRPQTRLLAGYNARNYRPAISDPDLKEALEMRRLLDEATRYLGWMNARV